MESTQIFKKNTIIPYCSEYEDFQHFINSKTSVLFEHEIEDQQNKRKQREEKYGFLGRYGVNNCFFMDYENQRICIAADRSFIGMVTGQYIETCTKYPNSFGTGDALDVVRALYINNGFKDLGYSFLRYIDVALVFETCCYIFQKTKEGFKDEILRIDLFREIKPDPSNHNNLAFIGGLFHVLKHFSYQGKNLSTGHEDRHNNVDSLEEVVLKCIHAFVHKKKEETSDDFIFDEELTSDIILKYVFYKEACTGTFYIKSIHLKQKDTIKLI